MTLLSRLRSGLALSRSTLFNERGDQGVWVGQLSSSALSTATAVTALAIYARTKGASDAQVAGKITSGLRWLASHVNSDGGWGDTTLSLSNISTTTLCWAAFGAVPGMDPDYASVVAGAEAWLSQHAGGLAPNVLASAIIHRYGEDRTFSIPILTMCALAGRLGPSPKAWSQVLPLPFELAAFPPELFAALRLPVVSYALPALIAMGVAHHRHSPSRHLLAWGIRSLAEPRVMSVLTRIQPSNGGFLEATPLTSFVTMSLAGSGYAEHVVTRKGVQFLLDSMREDGSWPIDTNLSTWLTTLAVNALGQHARELLPAGVSEQIQGWLLGQQHSRVHPYTNAAPGGWSWTDLPGGVPDADDTAGALVALRALGASREPVARAAVDGVRWLLGLQNRDGGVPTFCRGWGKLAFDQSSADLTAHALRAWIAWLPTLPQGDQNRTRTAIKRAIRFLRLHQQTETKLAGAWRPLWFGDQHGPEEINWTYGTARVLQACAGIAELQAEVLRAAHWLTSVQADDGGWGGGIQSGTRSVEETALAIEALSTLLIESRTQLLPTVTAELVRAIRKGVCWLLERVEAGSWVHPSPIGFYFARLWYFEKLYPVIFSVGALTAAERLFTDLERQ